MRHAIRTTNNDIRAVRSQVGEVTAQASQEAQQALDEMRRYVESLRVQLDNPQKLDLKWAIYGVAITALGVFLNFFA